MAFRANRCAATLLACTFAAAPLAAQQDTGMMHDSTMAMHDSTMMTQDSAMMGHDDAMGMDKGTGMMFMGAAGQKAAGAYAVTEEDGKQQLALADDFAVASAPDLYLVLADGATPGTGALWLGKLQRATGAQTYSLPKGKDLSAYTALLVWSKKEKRAVASAEWHPAAGGSMNHM